MMILVGLEASMSVRSRASFNPRGGEGSFPSPYFSFGCFLAIAILNICNDQLNIFYTVNLFYWPYLVQVNLLVNTWFTVCFTYNYISLSMYKSMLNKRWITYLWYIVAVLPQKRFFWAILRDFAVWTLHGDTQRRIPPTYIENTF